MRFVAAVTTRFTLAATQGQRARRSGRAGPPTGTATAMPRHSCVNPCRQDDEPPVCTAPAEADESVSTVRPSDASDDADRNSGHSLTPAELSWERFTRMVA